MQCDDRIAVIILAGQKRLHADLLESRFEVIEHFLNFRYKSRIRLFISHFNHVPDIITRGNKRVVSVYILFQGREKLCLLLSFFRIIPEMRIFHLSL